MAAIFLDLDGTLVDPKPGITGAVRHALREIGLTPPEPDALEWVIGPPLLDSFARLGAPDPARALTLYREHYSAGGLFDATVYKGIFESLAQLKSSRHRLFLATAKPHVFAKRITEKLGLNRWLEAEFGPELDGTRNDKGVLLAHACGLLGLDPTNAVMVGDRDNDLNAARAVGMRFVGVEWGFGGGGELDSADAICKTPGQLSGVLNGLAD